MGLRLDRKLGMLNLHVLIEVGNCCQILIVFLCLYCHVTRAFCLSPDPELSPPSGLTTMWSVILISNRGPHLPQ